MKTKMILYEIFFLLKYEMDNLQRHVIFSITNLVGLKIVLKFTSNLGHS